MTPPNLNNVSGCLVTYNSSKTCDITKTNYYLFGRIATIKKSQGVQKYYYPGILENIPFRKLSNGCYFVTKEDLKTEVTGSFKSLIRIIPAIVTFSDGSFTTSRESWRKKMDENVNNW